MDDINTGLPCHLKRKYQLTIDQYRLVHCWMAVVAVLVLMVVALFLAVAVRLVVAEMVAAVVDNYYYADCYMVVAVLACLHVVDRLCFFNWFEEIQKVYSVSIITNRQSSCSPITDNRTILQIKGAILIYTYPNPIPRGPGPPLIMPPRPPRIAGPLNGRPPMGPPPRFPIPPRPLSK